MRRSLLILGVLAFALAASTMGETLTILHLNDTHSHLLPYGPKDAAGNGTWGGMARVATLVGVNKMTESNVILLHAGDFFVGDFMFQKYLGVPELEIMKQLGYDALELGNHEFDLYPSTLQYVLDQAGFPNNGFPVLCANLDYSADPAMGYFVKPYVIKQYGAVKVGIFGLLTDFTNSGSNPAPDHVIPPLDVAQAWIDSLKVGHGCDVIILLSHLGVDMDQMVAGTTYGIDVIVGGHTHTQLNQPLKIGTTLILQAGEFAHYLGKLHLYVDNGTITGSDYQLIPVEAAVPQEPSLAGMLTGLAAGVEADPRFGPVYTQAVAKASIDLDRDFGHGLVMDNPMGNLIADAFRKSTGTDIAFQPQGFINQQVWAGPVFGNDIFQAVPYGFDPNSGLGLRLATFQTDGRSLMAGLEFSVYNLPYLEDFFLHASNFSFAYNSTNSPGSRIDYASIMVGGIPLNPAGSYTVTAPDGVLPFLSQISGFNMSHVTVTDKFMYTVVKDYMKARTPVTYYREGRILDLASLENPVEGAKSIAGVVDLYRTSGLLKKGFSVEFLQHQLEGVIKSLQRGRTMAALLELQAIRIQLTVESRCGRNAVPAYVTLKYLVMKLIESIRRSSGIAWKESDLEESDLAPEPPRVFDLGQNFPNPFNPTTRIEFSLPAATNVTLDIFNVLGENVKTLVDGPMGAGSHRIEWNSTDARGQAVASGVYFYRIAAGDQVATKKMLLMK